MAKVKLSGLVQDISGSIGGYTFQKSRYGLSLKSKHIPLNYFSQDQQIIRGIMSRLRASWYTQTSDVIAQYTYFSQFIQRYTKRSKILISPMELFIKYNFHRLLNGYSILTSFQYIVNPINDITVRFIYPDYGAGYILINSTPDLTDIFVTLKLSPQIKSGRNNNFNRLRFLNYTINGSTELVITNTWPAKFGAWPANHSYVFCQLIFFLKDIPVVYAPFNFNLLVDTL